MKKVLLLLLLLLLIPNICYGAAATTMYVTPTGAGAKDGAAWASAFGYSEWETDFEGSSEAGDVYYVAGGTFTLTSDFTAAARAGTAAAYIEVIGVKSGTTAEPPVYADYAFTTDRPLFDDGANDYQFITGNYWKLHNLRATLSGAVGISVGTENHIVNCKSVNPTGMAFSNREHNVRLIGCEAEATSSTALDLHKGSPTVRGCYIHDSVIGIDVSVATEAPRVRIIGSIIDSCTTGVNLGATYEVTMTGNTIYNCTTGIAGGTSYRDVFINNIIDNCTTGASWTGVELRNYWDYNCWDNTDDTENVTKGNNAVTGDPLMTDPVNGDFTLQSGSPCIDTGFQVGTNQGVIGDYKVNIGVDQDDVVQDIFGWIG